MIKLSGTHTSAITLTQRLLKYLNRFDPDLKVSLGIIQSKRSATARNHKIKIKAGKTGLALTVTQNATIQRLRIFTPNPSPVAAIIKHFGQDNQIQVIDQ